MQDGEQRGAQETQQGEKVRDKLLYRAQTDIGQQMASEGLV